MAYDFESPGAAFTGQITQLLAQRKADERQQMLDRLTMNADVRAQEAAAREARDQERREAESKASLAANAQSMELQKLAQLTAPLDIDEDPTARGYKPEDIALMQKWGVLHQLPTPNVSTSSTFSDEQGQPLAPADQGPSASGTPMANPSGNAQPVNQPVKPRYGYVGTAAQREKAKLRAQSGAVIQSLMDKPETLEAGQFLAKIAQANDGIVPADTLAQYTAPPTHIGIFDEPTGKVTVDGKPVTAIGPNTKVFNKGYGPATFYHNPMDKFIVTPTGLIQIGKDGKPTLITQDANGNPLTNRAPGADQSLGIPQTTYDRHAENILILHPDENRKVDPTRMALFRTSAARMINEAKVNDNVKRFARTFIVSPNDASALAQQLKFTPHDAQELRELLSAIIPDDYSDLLALNPPPRFANPKKPAQNTGGASTPSIYRPEH